MTKNNLRETHKESLNTRLCPLWLAMAGVFPSMAAEIVPDTAAKERPEMQNAANGTPVVNIVDPNLSGLSHNKFQDFNVGKEGLILNNSKQDGVSQIGGYTMKNPNLDNEAKGILSEVTGAKGTRIEGMMEVFGGKADVIIANQNGIQVNGASVVNANSLTLSTGKVLSHSDGSISLSVEKGQVDIQNGGISTKGLDYFDIVSRSAKLEGEIAGDADIQVLTGLNDYTQRDRKFKVRNTKKDNTPAVAIDGSALGSMYGGRIQIISTESGAGVRHQGSLVGQQDIEISVDGNLMLAGVNSTFGGVKLSGRNVNIQKNTAGIGGIISQNDLAIRALSHLALDTDIQSNSGTVTINAGSLLQSVATIMANHGQGATTVPAIHINVAGEYQLIGQLEALDSSGKLISNAVIILQNGNYIVKTNGQIINNAVVVSTAQVVASHGDITVSAGAFKNAGASVLAKNGALVVSVSSVMENSGIVNAKGTISLAGDSLLNKGTIFSLSAQNIQLGSLDNQGVIASNNKITIATTEFKNTDTISSNHSEVDLSIASETVENAGTISGERITIKQTTGSSNKLVNKGNVKATKDVKITTNNLANSGSLLAGDAMQLAVSKKLDNNGTISAGGKLELGLGSAELNIANQSENGWIQAGDLLISGANSLSNTDGATLLAEKTLILTKLNRLLNSSGSIIQANDILLTQIKQLENNSAYLQAGGNLTLEAIQLLLNQNGYLSSDNALVLHKVSQIVNEAGTIQTGDSLSISDSDVIRNENAGSIIAGENLTIDTATLLLNATDSSIYASGGDLRLNNINELKNYFGGILVTDGNFTADGIQNFNNFGIVQASNDVTLSHILQLNNHGDSNDNGDTLFMAGNQLSIKNVDIFTNSGTAIVEGSTGLLIDKVNTLVNDVAYIQSSGGDANISAGSVDNRSEAIFYAGKNLSVTANRVSNTAGGVLASGGNIGIFSNKLLNDDGSVINAYGHLNIQGEDIVDNTNGSIIAVTAGNVKITANRINNNTNSSIMTNSGDVIIDAHIFNNQAGDINSARNMILSVGSDFNINENSGSFFSNGSMFINTKGNISINRQFENIGSISLSAKGNITNNHSIASADSIWLKGGNITNNQNGLIWAMKHVDIDARGGKFHNDINGNVLSQGTISIFAYVIENYAGIISSLGNVFLDAREIRNTAIYSGGDNDFWTSGPMEAGRGDYKETFALTGKAAWIVDAKALILKSNIMLDKLATISSGEDILINQRSHFDSSDLYNEGAIIQAAGDIRVTGNVHNISSSQELTMEDYLRVGSEFSVGVIKTKFSQDSNRDIIVTYSSFYVFLDAMFGNGYPSKYQWVGDKKAHYDKEELQSSTFSKTFPLEAIRNLAKNNGTFNSTMISLFGDDWVLQSRNQLSIKWAGLTANNNVKLKEKKIYLQASERASIVAGNNIIHDGGSLDNGINNASSVITEGNTVSVDVGDKTIETKTNTYDALVNPKKVEEVRMGIGTLPSLTDLVSVPGLFNVSSAWLAQSANGNVKFNPTNNIVPKYETRLEMIDQVNFFGSDYFFEQVGYAPEQPVNVIGDNYFISKLVERQVNKSVGTFFAVRDGLMGENIVKQLMKNAGDVVANTALGLVIGEGLTVEQMNNLDIDIIWFVNEQIDGETILVPRIYLSQLTIQQMDSNTYDGAAIVHANGSMSIDASSMNNINGIISANGSIVAKSAGDINNYSSGTNGGLNAGKDVYLVSTAGDITSSGASVRAGNDITMLAEKGSIELTASVGRGYNGKQIIHANEDDVTASGNINMQAKEIIVNAVDITAVNDLNIKSTEGDVVFNNLHQIDANYSHESSGKGLNYIIQEDKSITATSVGSSATAGGKLNIHSANDIVMKGGKYTAQDGEIRAENNVDIHASQNYMHSESYFEQQEFKFGAGVSGLGHSASAEHGTVSGNSSDTSSGEYVSAGSESKPSSGGKRPGKAPTADSASFEIGLSKITDKTTTDSTTNNNASLNFDNSLTVDAGKTADIGGADMKAGDELKVIAENVDTTKYIDEVTVTNEHTEFFAGISGEGHSSVADAANKWGNQTVKGHEGMDQNIGLDIVQLGGDVSNVLFNDLLGGTVSIGANSSKSKTSTVTTSENITTIEANKVNITTTGDTNLNGTTISGSDVAVNVGGDLNIQAAKSTYSSTSDMRDWSAGISGGASVDVTGAGAGVSIYATTSTENTRSDSMVWTNSSISGDNITIKSGNDFNIKGGNIEGATVNVDVAHNLNIESLQDKDYSTTERQSGGFSAGVALSTSGGIIPTVSGNGGGGSEFYDKKATNQQSGIHASDTLNTNIGGDLNISGGHLISDTGNGKVNIVGNINSMTLVDSVEQDGAFGGAGAGISVTGRPTGNFYADTIDEIHYQENQKVTIAVNDVTSSGITGDINIDSNSLSTVVRDEKEAGNHISYTLPVPGGGKNKGDYEVNGRKPSKVDGPVVKPPKASEASAGANGISQPQPVIDGPVVKPPKASEMSAGANGISQPQPVIDEPVVKPPKASEMSAGANGISQPQPVIDGPVVKPPKASEMSAGANGISQPQSVIDGPVIKPPKTSEASAGANGISSQPQPVKKWPTVEPADRFKGSAGSSQSDGLFNKPSIPVYKTFNGDMPGAQPPKAREPSAGANGISSQPQPVKKWPTVEPADRFKGSAGSSQSDGLFNKPSIPVYKTFNGDMPGAQPPKAREPSAGANGISSQPQPVKKWPTVEPAQKVIGSVGSATSLPGHLVPSSPTPRAFNGASNSIQWKALLPESMVDIYATVSVNLKIGKNA